MQLSIPVLLNSTRRAFLRFISPVQFTKPRFLRKDIELGGVRLKKGEKIMAMLAAANLDPQANAHPEKLDLERKPNRHIAFGTGIHFCLGHQLARIEGTCAEEQPHAKQIAHAPQPTMRSPDKEREPVPVTSDAERPLPNAWRDVPRRPKG